MKHNPKHLIPLLTITLLTLTHAQNNPFRELPPPAPPEPPTITDNLIPAPPLDIATPPDLPMPGALSPLPPVITIPLDPIILPLTNRLPLTIPTSTPTPQAPQHEPPITYEITTKPTPTPTPQNPETTETPTNTPNPTTPADADAPAADAPTNPRPTPNITTLAFSRGANATALLRLNDETKLVRDGETISEWGVTIRITGDGVTFETVP